MFVPLGDFVCALQLFSIVVFDTERAANFLDDVLIRCRHVAARRFVAARIRLFPVCVDVSAG